MSGPGLDWDERPAGSPDLDGPVFLLGVCALVDAFWAMGGRRLVSATSPDRRAASPVPMEDWQVPSAWTARSLPTRLIGAFAVPLQPAGHSPINAAVMAA